jgi:hypothetical protein
MLLDLDFQDTTIIIRWSLVRAQVGPQEKQKPHSDVGVFYLTF